MLLKFSYIALLLAGISQPAFCAHNFEQTLADMDAIERVAREVGSSIDNYHGGLAEAVAVGNSARTAQQTADSARKNLDMDSDRFTDAEAKQVMDHYDQTSPIILENLRKLTEKAPEFRKAGVGSIAQGMVRHMQGTRNGLRDSLQKKLPEGDDGQPALSDDQIEHAFQQASDAFSQ
ncbi:hypothetical protein APSETT444_010703 [Aspergillus pseudonomiae]